MECLTCGAENVAGIFVCSSCGQNPAVFPPPVQRLQGAESHVVADHQDSPIATNTGVCPDPSCGAPFEPGATCCPYCGGAISTTGAPIVLEFEGECIPVVTSLVVGRDETLGFGLMLAANDLVSRRQFEVTWDGSSAVVEDLDSTNGTYCDGDEVMPHRKHKLQNGNVLRIGKSGPCILVKINEEQV